MRTVRIACAVFALAAIAPLATLQAQRSRAKKEDPFFTGAPFSLDDLLQRIGVISDTRLREAVLRRGVNFSPTPADNDKMKKAGASAELIATIGVKAPPPPKPAAPPPPPKPVFAGTLTLECAPAECEISVDKKLRGTTATGALQVKDLPPG
ncbi:MAG: hypothetical protein ACRD30_06740, partial [Bryobacteraceae bacterium]